MKVTKVDSAKRLELIYNKGQDFVNEKILIFILIKLVLLGLDYRVISNFSLGPQLHYFMLLF